MHLLHFSPKSFFSNSSKATFGIILHQGGCIAPPAQNKRVQMHLLHPCCRRPWGETVSTTQTWTDKNMVYTILISRMSWFKIIEVTDVDPPSTQHSQFGLISLNFKCSYLFDFKSYILETRTIQRSKQFSYRVFDHSNFKFNPLIILLWFEEDTET